MSTAARDRIIDLDVARAVALVGVVVMNYWGYLVLDGSPQGTSFVNRVFDPWTGPLSTRFATVFVMVAGMGITLMTNRSRGRGDKLARSDDRWKLVRRAVLLYSFGYLFDWIWGGTILFFYGAFFFAGALLFTLRGRWLALIGAASAVAATLLQLWKFQREQGGHSTAWLFSPSARSPRGLLFDTFVNGTHPLLPWLAFLCLGMILGRLLPLRVELRIIGAFLGIMLAIFSHLIHGAAATTKLLAIMLGDGPYSRSLVYTIGTIGSSVAAFCIIGTVAELTRHSRVTQWFAAAGRTTLTIYVLHALVFNLLVHDLGWVRPTGLDTAWVMSGAFWVMAILTAGAWQRRFGMGPLERVYRRFGGDPHPAVGSRRTDNPTENTTSSPTQSTMTSPTESRTERTRHSPTDSPSGGPVEHEIDRRGPPQTETPISANVPSH